MKFKTAITNIQTDGTEIIRGHNLADLIANKTFVETIFLILKGHLPTSEQTKMMNAIFTAIIDHGPATSSAMNARISASAKNDLHTSVAAGLLGLGGRHGVVVEPAMKFFYDHVDESDIVALLKNMKERKEYASGFGHKIFAVDPRTQALFKIAKETGIYGQYATFAQKIEIGLNSISSKKLPLNVDGAIAAILCDMGFDARIGNGIFVIARVPGLVAHIVEEITNDEGIRRLTPEDIEYIGTTSV
ncbi:MAG: hypothetical protein A2821_04590 [Candidatus Magasanikbacteria bacterium RIFCSPHIGHO2_01_FULL_41_23]|uniref:citrate synthase (unknown stereospecificity) n=1 Tax=Candidatus Magasanikbacteria bacterium RIFCSPLOWO2_01_FULL_40_15 TaxID=1798686 RepID=A0A1F6N411_9BACT|nr:MAG: hypothetical protein A2821_04590 [Candidatus Magasanikbacteria bacterium RIFCSPHIGHO2_01_FULL_41_23]OGH67200.1 MAG: hypothetical protein A3C66_02900 [Candidatus Magasanikbacteria bacterium RIFCSPHIGHO2_02_FULL_41_35]OGH75434.1 MAG: hypothetical protein A3F22_01240 [Candidatus Magasanikbacteria bacterium RIFCSPHIGHO2_12_FULL_41_16]OGH78736.1 MAG: hypothetical protein A2983_04540 [Candidatus Magasanikbacteria bacterium RIFCSPLOWO2_01_FULL_40_15]